MTDKKNPVVVNGDNTVRANKIEGCTGGYDGKSNTNNATMQESAKIISIDSIPGDEPPHQSEAETPTYEHLRITDTTPIPEPEPLLTINGELIATIEDIFTISGASKSGKSAFTSMLIAGAISTTGEIFDGLEGVQILQNADHKAVVHIDTEQARHKQLNNVKNILRRANLTTCPPYYLSYNIRQLEIKDYKSTTTGIIEEAYQLCAGIHSIWIDGGADYIRDVNDPDASNDAVKYFEELAIRYHTAVFIVVHTNPNTPDKERGHFGSQCQRKSGGVLRIKTEGDHSYIEPGILRYAGKGDIPKLMFRYDKDKKYHVGCGILNEGIDAETKAYNKLVETFKLCTKVFSGQRAYRYKDAIDQIIGETGTSINPAKKQFTIMKAKEMIIQGTDENWRANINYQLV